MKDNTWGNYAIIDFSCIFGIIQRRFYFGECKIESFHFNLKTKGFSMIRNAERLAQVLEPWKARLGKLGSSANLLG